MNQKSMSNALVMRIDAERKKQKLSYADIALKAGITKKEAINLFTLEDIPSFATFLAVSRCLGLHFSLQANGPKYG